MPPTFTIGAHSAAAKRMRIKVPPCAGDFTESSGQNGYRSAGANTVKQVADIFIEQTHTAMGDRMANGPAMGSAMEASRCAAFDVQHALAIKTLTTKTVLVKADPSAAQGIFGILTGDYLTGLGVSP